MKQLSKLDQKFLSDGWHHLIGIDEAGWGPLAGPVVAAAVLLHTPDFCTDIRDSKQMTAKQRQRAFLEIQEKASIGIGIMNETIIDTFNILEASFLAMNAAVRQLNSRLSRRRGAQESPEKTFLLIDGNQFKTDLPYACATIISGDCKSLPIACASIIAKVTRDRILDTYHQIFPQYGFDRHKGYPTAAHRQALQQHGPAPIHRRTFQTLKNLRLCPSP